MVIDKLIKHIEAWAPPGAAWEKDNVGLLVGSGENEVKNVFLSLELNGQALKEALRKNCNFLFTHHPFIYNPIRKLNFTKDPNAAILQTLIKKDISLYAAHTNLDFTKGGVSFSLAETLKLNNIKFLQHFAASLYKLVIFVPEKNLQQVADAVFNAGGGVIGEYEKCSFIIQGEGTFKGSENTSPFVGKKNVFEKVKEVRFETTVSSYLLNKVISAMLKAHPYEEPAYDLIPLQNADLNYGEGTIGTLKKEMNENDFVKYVCKSLKGEGLRYSGGKGKKISKVAVCGGSGAQLLNKAIAEGADAFITADVKYHTFQEAENRILLIDAGHYETEIHSLAPMKEKIENLFRSENVKAKVFLNPESTNPVKFYKQ